MAVKDIRPGLILLASALPLLARIALILLSSAGHIDHYGLGLLYMPIDVLLFAACFSLAFLTGKGLSTSAMVIRGLLFSFSLFCVNAALSIGYMFFGLFLMAGAAAFIAPGLSAGACLALYGFFLNHFFESELKRSAFIRLFALGAIAGIAPFIVVSLLPQEFSLQLANSVWYLAAGLGLYLESVIALEEQTGQIPKVEDKPRTILPACKTRRRGLSLKTGLGIAFVPPLLLLTISIAGIFMNFDGYCYGFTDGKWACSVWESMANQLGFALLFFSLPVLGWVGLVLFMTDFRSILRQEA